MRSFTVVLWVCLFLLAGCSGIQNETPTIAAEPTPVGAETPTPTDAKTATKTETATPTDTETPTEVPPDNPWDSDPVVVAFSDESGSDRNYTKQVESGLQYWNERVENYTAYSATFSLETNRTAGRSDVTITITEDASYCGYEIDLTTRTRGCYTTDGNIEVLPSQTNLQVRNTVIHEVGHALGLDHSSEPHWVMATNDSAVSRSVTDARDRNNPWNATGTLGIAVGDSLDQENAYTREVESVVRYYNRNEHYLPNGVELEVVDEWYEAHIIVEDSSKSRHLFTGPGSVGGVFGLDYDADEEFEMYTRGSVYLHDIRPRDSEAHIGHWVGRHVGNSRDTLPPRYSK